MFIAIVLAALLQCAFGQYLNSGCGCGGASILASGPIASSQLVQGVGSSALIGASLAPAAYPLTQSSYSLAGAAYPLAQSSYSLAGAAYPLAQSSYSLAGSAYPLAQVADVGVISSGPAIVQLTNNGYNAAAPGFANNYGGGAGGVGEGQVQLQGQLPIVGVNVIRGSLPVQGLCGFAGNIAAGGIINTYASVPCTC